jgi:peroxiredoxin/uncharacterized membrane protein YphA (DoxX/SURF4 family)
MSFVLLASRFFLALMFIVAGLAKLGDPPGTRSAFSAFGVPRPFIAPLAFLLPFAELVIAAALLPTLTAWWGALAAMMLLLLFTIAISYQLLHGHTPDCHCFGQLHSKPIGRSTLLRNGLFLSAALFVLVAGWQEPGPSVLTLTMGLSLFQLLSLAGGLLLLMLALAEAWFILLLLRQQGRLLLRVDAVEERLMMRAVQEYALPAIKAPSFELSTLEGERLSLAQLLAPAKPLLLVFADPNCSPCQSLLFDVENWQRTLADRLSIFVISRGTVEENRTKSRQHGISPTLLLLQESFEVAQAFGVQGTPAAVFVQPNGALGSEPLNGADKIRTFVNYFADARVVQPVFAPAGQFAWSSNGNAYAGDCNCGKNGHGHTHQNSHVLQQALLLNEGEQAPALRLPDLDGRFVDLADWRGTPVLLLFWNPTCGYCANMLHDLKAWEKEQNVGAPQLLVISTGSPEANRTLGLAATVVLDAEFSAGHAFGASGTPSAVLLDAQGKIASRVAVGAVEVLALARSLQPAQVEDEGGKQQA